MSRSDDLDLNDLPVFMALVEAGSFTAAADRLGCAKTRVSLVIKRLEERLGITLFTRTTRRVSVTAAGERLYQGSRPLLEGLGQVFAEAETSSASLSGSLRISAPEDFSERVLAPVALAFRRLHPNLHLELRSSNQIADMVGEGIDLAIRLGWPRDSSLRALRLGHFEQYLVASPAYLERAGKPTRPEQLSDHAWVALSPLPRPLTWTFRRGNDTRRIQMRAAFTVNTAGVAHKLLVDGAGLSVLPDIDGRAELDSGRLVRILPGWKLERGGIYAIYPPGRYLSSRTRTFVDFLRERLEPGHP